MSAVEELEPLYMYVSLGAAAAYVVYLNHDASDVTVHAACVELAGIDGVQHAERMTEGGAQYAIGVRLDSSNLMEAYVRLKSHVKPRYDYAGHAAARVIRRASDHVHIGTIVKLPLLPGLFTQDELLDLFEKLKNDLRVDRVDEEEIQVPQTLVFSLGYPEASFIEETVDAICDDLGLFVLSCTIDDHPDYALLSALDYRH